MLAPGNPAGNTTSQDPNMRRGGLQVVDGTAPKTLRITERDISAATQADARQCAIAQCVKRQKGVLDVQVGASTVFVKFNDRVERYVLSPEDRKRVAVFDTDGYFKPSTYTLLPPPTNRKIGARAGTKPGSQTREGTARNVDRAAPIRGRVSPGKFLA